MLPMARKRTDTMISQAADYNHTGIELLTQGRHRQALDMFKEAARLMQRLGNGECGRPDTFSRTTSTYSEEANDDVRMSEESSNAELTHPCHPSSPYPRLDVDGCFMVCTPLEISSSENYDHASAAACVVFNMALTYHLLPVVSSQKLASRRQALSLYEMAYDLALSNLENDLSSRITMVTLLNMALIEKEFGNSQEAERCLVDLSEYIISLEEESSSKEVSNQRHEFLLKATLLLQFPLGAAAA